MPPWPNLADDLPAPRDDEPSSLRQDIADELADHLNSAFNRELHLTRDETTAKEKVLDRFGDPRAINTSRSTPRRWEHDGPPKSGRSVSDSPERFSIQSALHRREVGGGACPANLVTDPLPLVAPGVCGIGHRSLAARSVSNESIPARQVRTILTMARVRQLFFGTFPDRRTLV